MIIKNLFFEEKQNKNQSIGLILSSIQTPSQTKLKGDKNRTPALT